MDVCRALVAVVMLAVSGSAAAEIPPAWTRAVEPFRIAGNLYYVGTEDLGAYVLAGTDGLILLDAPLEENSELVLRNIRKLGFDPASVRILLNSHAHFDHAGGMATLKKITGAKLYLSAADSELAARGGRGDFAFGDRFPYASFEADEKLRDGQTIRLGNVAMTALLTPGHTRGCTTWQTTVVEEDRPLDVVLLCSVTAPGYELVKNEKYPEIFDDYRRSFEKLRALRPDIFLANHGSFFGLKEKISKRVKGGANPFIDAAEFPRFLDRAWRDLEKQAGR